MKTVYFILGMHRSGTSALSGVLNLAGMDVGTDLMPSTDDNKNGYFENYKVFWFNEKGTKYKRITSGNIRNIFEINGQIYVTKGLAHLSISKGQIFKVIRKNGEWSIEKKVSLPSAPYATTLIKDNEFIIVTSKGLLKVNKNFEIETLVEEGF